MIEFNSPLLQFLILLQIFSLQIELIVNDLGIECALLLIHFLQGVNLCRGVKGLGVICININYILKLAICYMRPKKLQQLSENFSLLLPKPIKLSLCLTQLRLETLSRNLKFMRDLLDILLIAIYFMLLQNQFFFEFWYDELILVVLIAHALFFALHPANLLLQVLNFAPQLPNFVVFLLNLSLKCWLLLTQRGGVGVCVKVEFLFDFLKQAYLSL